MLNYEITTPERVVLRGEARSVTLPTKDGYITILPHHVPLVAALGSGEMVIRKTEGEEILATEGGFIEFQKNNTLAILAEFAVKSEELEAEEVIKKAIESAKQALLTTERKNTEAFTFAAAHLEREFAKLHVSRKRRRHVK